jgi:uncharacterized protein (DUF1810 family)
MKSAERNNFDDGESSDSPSSTLKVVVGVTLFVGGLYLVHRYLRPFSKSVKNPTRGRSNLVGKVSDEKAARTLPLPSIGPSADVGGNVVGKKGAIAATTSPKEERVVGALKSASSDGNEKSTSDSESLEGRWSDMSSQETDSEDVMEELNKVLSLQSQNEFAYVKASKKTDAPASSNFEACSTEDAAVPLNIRNLLKKQGHNCSKILEDLRQNGRKTQHWIWWVFPTDKPGQSEPMPETFVLRSQRQRFVQLSENTNWRPCLELLATLIGEKGLNRVLPGIDHGRVYFFCLFWDEIRADLPSWLKGVIDVFRRSGAKCKYNMNCTFHNCSFVHDTADYRSPSLRPHSNIK